MNNKRCVSLRIHAATVTYSHGFMGSAACVVLRQRHEALPFLHPRAVMPCSGYCAFKITLNIKCDPILSQLTFWFTDPLSVSSRYMGNTAAAFPGRALVPKLLFYGECSSDLSPRLTCRSSDFLVSISTNKNEFSSHFPRRCLDREKLYLAEQSVK